MKSINDIASEYVESLGEVIEGYKYGFGSPKEFIAKYYFDFKFITLDGNIPIEPPLVGGACGFTINKKDKTIEILSFGEFANLEQKERELNEIYNRLEDIKRNSTSLNWLKTEYSLSSPELLKIKNTLLKTNFQKEEIIIQLDALISKNR